MGRTLDIHPLVVLVVTALGGSLVGIVGPILLSQHEWVVATQTLARLRRNGLFSRAVDRAEPAVRQMLS